MVNSLLKLTFAVFLLVSAAGCISVKPYQRVYLNDPEMQLETKSVAQFESYYEAIREGSVTSSGGKSSDGCGCR